MYQADYKQPGRQQFKSLSTVCNQEKGADIEQVEVKFARYKVASDGGKKALLY